MSTVAVVVPSPVSSLVRETTSRTIYVTLYAPAWSPEERELTALEGYVGPPIPLDRISSHRGPVTFHVLWHGAVLCGNVHGLPRHWGMAHRWVGLNFPGWREHATCATCREAGELLDIEEHDRIGVFWPRYLFVRPESVPLPSGL